MMNSTTVALRTAKRLGLAITMVLGVGLLAACGGGSSADTAAPQAAAPLVLQPANPDPVRGNDPPVVVASKFARFAYVSSD